MPRKNRRPKHIPFEFKSTSRGKKRYTTKREAEKAADIIMLMDMTVQISTYKDIDGGWYLTSR